MSAPRQPKMAHQAAPGWNVKLGEKRSPAQPSPALATYQLSWLLPLSGLEGPARPGWLWSHTLLSSPLLSSPLQAWLTIQYLQFLVLPSCQYCSLVLLLRETGMEQVMRWSLAKGGRCCLVMRDVKIPRHQAPGTRPPQPVYCLCHLSALQQ